MFGTFGLALALAIVAAIILEVAKRPFRTTWGWLRKWARLIWDLPRLERAVENISWMMAYDEADYGRSDEEHQQAVQRLHDHLTGRADAEGVRRKPRSPFG